MENYFYLNEKNEQKGPVSPEELISNGVTKNTLVWKNGMAQWLPAGEVSELANLFTDSYFFASILGNALLFSPLALLLPWKTHAKHNLAVSAAILIGMVILFETVQQLSHVGVFDIDDILLNSLGIAAGTVLHIPIDRLIKTHFAIR